MQAAFLDGHPVTKTVGVFRCCGLRCCADGFHCFEGHPACVVKGCKVLGLLDLEDASTVVLQNIRSHLPSHSASYLLRYESLETTV